MLYHTLPKPPRTDLLSLYVFFLGRYVTKRSNKTFVFFVYLNNISALLWLTRPYFPIVVPDEDSCEMTSTKEFVRIDDCVSVGEVDRSMCAGSCASSAQGMFEYPYVSGGCTCCKPATVQMISVRMECGKPNQMSCNIIYRLLGYERVYLPLYKVADTYIIYISKYT